MYIKTMAQAVPGIDVVQTKNRFFSPKIVPKVAFAAFAAFLSHLRKIVL